MSPLLYLLTFVVSAFALLTAVQARPSFLLLLPILLLSVALGWYLNRHIQEEHEENIKKGFYYEQDEENAQHWLHQSFVPKTRILLKKHIKETILYSGILLLLFIFFWTYFVGGVMNALLCTFIAATLYTIFIFYMLHVDKWYNYFFRRVPKQYKHYRRNDWVHGYIILLPFGLLCFLVYLLFNYNGNIVTTLFALPIFIFVYTLVFVATFCGLYLYKEYRKEEAKNISDSVKKMMDE